MMVKYFSRKVCMDLSYRQVILGNLRSIWNELLKRTNGVPVRGLDGAVAYDVSSNVDDGNPRWLINNCRNNVPEAAPN